MRAALIVAVLVALFLSMIGLVHHFFQHERRHARSHLVQTDYCVIDYRAAVKNPLDGSWLSGWAKGFGPCSLLDRYENI